MLRRYYIKS